MSIQGTRPSKTEPLAGGVSAVYRDDRRRPRNGVFGSERGVKQPNVTRLVTCGPRLTAGRRPEGASTLAISRAPKGCAACTPRQFCGSESIKAPSRLHPMTLLVRSPTSDDSPTCRGLVAAPRFRRRISPRDQTARCNGCPTPQLVGREGPDQESEGVWIIRIHRASFGGDGPARVWKARRRIETKV
jgi:hypothetical protein